MIMKKNNLSKMFFRCLSVLVFVVGVTSCAGSNTIKPASSVGPSLNISQEDMNGNSKLSEQKSLDANKTEANDKGINSLRPDNASNSLNNDYVLGPEDLIEINVYQVDELKRTVRISSSGLIKLPLVDTIKAGGLTASEIEAEIGKRLEKYLQEPVVSLFIKEYRSQRITVLGAVRNPQVLTVTNQNFLLDVVSLSGGLSSDAGEICYVRRGSETIVIDIDKLLIEGMTELNIPVFAGDVIHFPKGGVMFVDGAVRSPGSFPVKGKVTLTQAISMASGFQSVAIKSEVKVYRDTGKSERDIIPVDYDDILAQKSPDIELKDKDIIIVPTSAIKEFIKSISGAVSIGKASLSGGL